MRRRPSRVIGVALATIFGVVFGTGVSTQERLFPYAHAGDESPSPTLMTAAIRAAASASRGGSGSLGTIWTDGSWFAFFPAEALSGLIARDGSSDTRSSSSAQAGPISLALQPAWSPDLRRVATVTGPLAGASIAINEVGSGHNVAVYAVPQDVFDKSCDDGAPSYKLRWSPDGSKLLLSCRRAVVITVESGSVEEVTSAPAVAEWGSNSDGAYYFAIENPDTPPTRALGDLYFKPLGSSKATLLIDQETLGWLGVDVAPGLTYARTALSPSGSKLAVAAGSTLGGMVGLYLFDLKVGERPAPATPRSSVWTDDVIKGLEWTPDEKYMVALTVRNALWAAPDQPLLVAARTLDLESGTWIDVQSLTYGPIRRNAGRSQP